MRSLVTSKNVSWPRLIWPTLYMISCRPTYFTLGNCRDLNICKKINKIMKISQKDDILILNLYLSKRYGARRTLSEFTDNGWKVGSIDILLKRIHKTGTIVRQPGSGRPCSSRGSGGSLCSVRWTSQKDTDQLVRFRMKLPFSVQVCTG